ncbi:hypothetical protein TNCV_3703111 [Trichonephila clavipes]|nr:hypothetical protein TNCV_3703111 [Trichonephila clavipes]
MQAVETKIWENRRFTLTTFSLQFPDVSRWVVYQIVTEDLNFKKLCSRWSAHSKTQRKEVCHLIRLFDSLRGRIVTGNMGIPYHPGIKAAVYGRATRIFSRHGQSQANAVKAQDYGNSFLGPAVFCWWTLCHKKQRSTQVPTPQLYGSSEEHCKTNGAACCQKVLCSSMVTQGLKLLERLGS